MAIRSEARKNMSLHEEKPLTPGESEPEAEKQNSPVMPADGNSESSVSWAREETNPVAATEVAPYPPAKAYPEDLRISWSWPHFLVFIVFILVALSGVQTILYILYMPHQRMSAEQLQQYLVTKPQVAIGGTIAVYALLLFFLYVSLALLRGKPFWSTLGWKKLPPKDGGEPRRPLRYFFAGCGLSLVVFGLTAMVKTPENAPIEELFKFKQTAMLFVVMAVLVAPFAEETIFRGYLYPMFARWFGVAPSIILTGVLFGLMHGPQLGGAKSLIAVMSLVGICLTLIRARTGSVLASYLMHLGYNSLIGVSLILATHGFTKIPIGK
jgi:membrane protease YdiL (CAAX protease family)